MTRPVPEEREAQALRLIAVSFVALAGYVTVQAIVDLVQRHEPEASVPWHGDRCCDDSDCLA